MKKIIRLTESDLVKIVKKVISESNTQIDEDYFFENPTGKFKTTCGQIQNINGIGDFDFSKFAFLDGVDYLNTSGHMGAASTWGFCPSDCNDIKIRIPCCKSQNTIGCSWPVKNEWDYKYDASKKIFWLSRVGGELRDRSGKEVKFYAKYTGLEASLARIQRN